MISVEHVTKYYGDFLAVDDLSFQIDEGHVFGFLGPNGAGKSTTMNIMTGCLSASAGRVCIDGFDIFEQPEQAKKRIGYLPEQPPLYQNESPLEYLRFVGEAKGLRGQQLKEEIQEVVRQTGIESVKHRRISDLSKGFRQRVGIAQALLGNPQVIILDEPTVGLDPIQIIEIRELIRELGRTHTVIFSSHILSEVQTICDQILMIAGGKLVAFDTPENLEKQLLFSGQIEVTAEGDADTLEQLLGSVEALTTFQIEPGSQGQCLVHIQTDAADIHAVSGSIYRAFAKTDLVLMEMSVKRGNLEDVFLELAEGNTQPEEREETEE